MKTFFKRLLMVLTLMTFSISIGFAQTTGSIAGTIVDQTGAVVPNATITVTGQSGQEFKVNSSSNGTYNVPAVAAGFYTVSVSSTNFKTTVVQNVQVNVGVPATVDAALETGGVEETVVVTGGADVLQTQTATVSTNIQGRQITETPIASRDALDLVTLLPGTASVGAPRRSAISGLPKSAISITIDGVDVQDNEQRSAEGFFTNIRPRVDAIEEVTVSTSNPGAESSGDGAVQIKFVTKRGTNEYRGGVFWKHRDEGLNANYWYNNRNNIPRQKMRLNEYGGRLGGPIPFLNFGEGGPVFNSGKDRAFFFVNYEEFRLPEALSRTRTVLQDQARQGIFRYNSGGITREVNLLSIAQAANQPFTIDPTISTVLTRINDATKTEGTLTPISNDPNRQNYNFTPTGSSIRKFLALRFDFNLTKDHSLENVTNYQPFLSTIDFLNSQDPRFPGFQGYSQSSPRYSNSTALRSVFGQSIVNELRYNWSSAETIFSPEISPADFSYSGGFLLDIAVAGLTTPYSRNSITQRNSPNWEIMDSVTWTKGSHSFNFGGQFKRITTINGSQPRIVPTITFGIESTETAVFNAFNATTLPGASAAQLTEARNLYATLTGRVTGYTSTAYLTADGTYELNAAQERRNRIDTYGLFAQDTWRVRPGLTVTYGLRWQPQSSFVALTENYSRLSSFEQVYGVSGLGNLFKPGTLTGTVPTVVAMKAGEKAYKDDLNNFAPSVGVVWSPDYNEGILGTIFGGNGRSVFRGGYSQSFIREGSTLVTSILAANPGGNLPVSRTTAIGNLTLGTLLRNPGNPNLTPASFPTTPTYPIALTSASSTNAFSPDLKTGKVHSFSVGYQREIDQNTVVELRYVGSRGVDLVRQHNINELNTIENGLAAEFRLAQANLAANVAANRCQTGVTTANCQYNFAYFGPGTGTSPLPISLAYITGGNATAALSAASYQTAAAALFRNITFAQNLSPNGATVLSFGNNLENNAGRRANALNAGLPANFFYVNPTSAASGSYIVDNSAQSWYDSAVIEVRRRLSNGVRFQANYVFAKALANALQSNTDVYSNFTNRENGLQLAKNYAQFDIRHAFKMDATIDLPFGKGRSFFSNANWFTDALVGGFSLNPVIRWQSGSPFLIGNVQLVGMTAKELQNEVKVRKGPNFVTYLPDDIILNTQRAFNIDPTTTSGYGTAFEAPGSGANPAVGVAPTGRFIAPAGYGNCLQRYVGECGFTNLTLYGPNYFKFDLSVSKRFMVDEKRNVELRATFLDVLNNPAFRVGGFNADIVNYANGNSTSTFNVGGTTFGQLAAGSAYQDVSTTNDPGGRIIDLMLRINF